MADQDFKRLKRQPAYRVAEQAIQQKILDGTLASGDLLPPENELAEQLGITRPTVREALRGLENSGLVKRGPRRRMQVSAPPTHIVGEAMHHALVLHGTSYRAIWEVNMALEPAAAALAAVRIQPDVLELLAENLSLTESCLDDPERLVAADIEFHELVTRASGNPALLLARSALGELLLPAYGSVIEKIGPGQRLLEAHRRVFRALEDGDEVVAREWMSKHVRDFRRGCEVAGLDFDEPVRYVSRDSTPTELVSAELT